MNRLKTLGEFARSLAIRKTPLNATVGATGGFLVPNEVTVGINERLGEVSVFHRLARQQPMLSKTCTVPAFDVSASHATGTSPLIGGMVLTWTEEGLLATESEPKFSAAQLVAHELTGTVFASNQLVQDGGEALGAFLEWQFTQAIKWFVEYACLQGTGVGQPAGIITSPSTVRVARGVASHIDIADVAGMVASLLPGCFGNAVWMCSPTAIGEVIQLPTYSNWLHIEEPDAGLCGVLYGRPLYVTEKLPALGGLGDLLLFDPTLYVLGTRLLEIAMGTYEPTAFAKNQTIFRLLWRGDGQPLARGTSTLADGSTTSGAFVALN